MTKKLKPKEGAKKADGTPWTSVPVYSPSTEEGQERTLTALVATLLVKLDKERDVIASFIKNLNDDPANALEWSKNCFAAAARLKIYGQAYRAITKDDGTPELHRTRVDGSSFNTLDNLAEFSQKEVNSKARSPSYSSSPTTNLMEQEYLAAWSNILEMIMWS